MARIYIIGMGTGNKNQLTCEAQQAILDSDHLIGDRRILSAYEHDNKSIHYSTNVQEIRSILSDIGPEKAAAILVSGDVGFHSLAKSLLSGVDRPEDVHLICGISSLQYFAARLGIPWEDVVISSFHGKKDDLAAKVMKNHKVFVLTGGENRPADICSTLCDHGLGDLKVTIGENLSYDNEKITTAEARELLGIEAASLSVILIINENFADRPLSSAPGIRDEDFIRGEVPMTKQEIRVISIAKLQLSPKDVVYDIGAGTGSVAIEMAQALASGSVYAVEKNEEAAMLIEENKRKFKVRNLKIIVDLAPQGLFGLPAPDKVFIGGSGGNLKEILNAVYAKNPAARVVINMIALESLNEAMSYYKNREDYKVEVVNVAVSKAVKRGEYSMMTGQNPVFILTAEKAEQRA